MVDVNTLNSLMLNKENIASSGVVRFTSGTRWGEFVVPIIDIENEGWDAAVERAVAFFLTQGEK